MNTAEMVQNFISQHGIVTDPAHYDIPKIVECLEDVADGQPVTTLDFHTVLGVCEGFRTGWTR